MKDIKDYLHLYLGCRALLPNGKIDTLDYVEIEQGVYFPSKGTDTEDFGHNLLSEVKPILRPLSDMTEEEMLEAVSIGGLFYRGESVKAFIANWTCYSGEVTRYLLSKSFDLFNLIPEGLAIDSTTQKQ